MLVLVVIGLSPFFEFSERLVCPLTDSCALSPQNRSQRREKIIYKKAGIVFGGRSKISLGSTQKCWEEASQSVAAPCQELEQQLKDEPVLNVDETGWRPVMPAAVRRTRKLCSGGSLRHTELGRRVKSPSDVTPWMQTITNPGAVRVAGGPAVELAVESGAAEALARRPATKSGLCRRH